MIECVHAALRLQKQRMGPAAAKTPAPSQATIASQPTPQKVRLEGEALKNAILAFLKREGAGKPEGLHLTVLCQQADPAPVQDVTAALAKLVDDGEIFTTLDDKHFSCV